MKAASVLFLSIPLTVLAYETAEQTDWSGGGGVPGPVTDWSDTFDSSTDVNWSGFPGRFALSSDALDTPREHTVDGGFEAWSVYAADLDGDDDTDVLGASTLLDEIAWWENLDGSGTNWEKHTLNSDFGEAMSVYVADVDGDGDTDILGAAFHDDEIAWWKNPGEPGQPWDEHLVDDEYNGAWSVLAADLDDDGDADVLAAGANNVTWWENVSGSGSFWDEHFIGYLWEANGVYAGDVDHDGDIDVFGAAWRDDEIVWWENDGSGGGWAEHVVCEDFNGPRSVFTADINGDGDLDVIGAAYNDNAVTWWQNTDGVGTSWLTHAVDTDFYGADSVFAADVDGDNDTDIIGAADEGYDVTWWENADGSGTSWTEHLIDGEFVSAASVCAFDLDGDNDLDILGSGWVDGYVAWWEVTEFRDSGELISSILDTGGSLGWGVVDWIDDVPADTALAVEARGSDDPGAMGDWVEIAEGDLSDYLPDGLRYLQYRVGLESATGEATPAFNWIRFSWSDEEAVDDVEVCASAADDGILVDWAIRGDVPAGVHVLREVEGGVSPLHAELLPGSATRYLDRDVEPGIEYRYWLDVFEADGTVSRFGPTEAVCIGPRGLALSLSDPYPSPARDTVTISFTLPDAGPVELAVYDLAGRRVATVMDAETTAGRHEVVWDCSLARSGVYICCLKTTEDTIFKRLIVSR
jgi:hypothetical protein